MSVLRGGTYHHHYRTRVPPKTRMPYKNLLSDSTLGTASKTPAPKALLQHLAVVVPAVSDHMRGDGAGSCRRMALVPIMLSPLHPLQGFWWGYLPLEQGLPKARKKSGCGPFSLPTSPPWPPGGTEMATRVCPPPANQSWVC